MYKPILLLVTCFVAGCGSAPPVADRSGGAEGATGDEVAQRGYAANPLLNVYVQGPDADEGGGPDDYHASIVVTNTGDAPADLRVAHIRLDVVRFVGGDAEESVDCGPDARDTPVEGPMSLGPGRVYTYEGRLHCALPGPGEYEVRAYVSFAGAIPERDLERYHAGSYRVTVR